MESYVVVLLQGDYGDYLDTVQVQAESVEEAERKALAMYRDGQDAQVERVIKGYVVDTIVKGG